ncbi:hypothetical protein PSTT_09569 [Puccinia striiformis]|uniref:Uncharacterized protein n=1 Tax=Puccinia striiformis TaxID=27350 RepID=A0A2S4V7V7_9BASI|nr:hypothetical protein PSTT_09569 [Puccinia striiformis]
MPDKKPVDAHIEVVQPKKRTHQRLSLIQVLVLKSPRGVGYGFTSRCTTINTCSVDWPPRRPEEILASHSYKLMTPVW